MTNNWFYIMTSKIFELISKVFIKKEENNMSDIIVVLDGGHGIDTPGKRSPKWPDGTQLFEYEFNRNIVRRISEQLSKEKIKNYILVPEENDVPLKERVLRANKIYKENNKKCFLISIHANAGGGQGWEVFTSIGKTKADDIATIIWEEMKVEFPLQRMRIDTTDGDIDKEDNLYILRNTNCPAVLTENFFMDTKSDCDLIMSEFGRNKIANAHVRAIKRIIKELY